MIEIRLRLDQQFPGTGTEDTYRAVAHIGRDKFLTVCGWRYKGKPGMFDRIGQWFSRKQVPDAQLVVLVRRIDATAVGGEPCVECGGVLEEKALDLFPTTEVPDSQLSTTVADHSDQPAA